MAEWTHDAATVTAAVRRIADGRPEAVFAALPGGPGAAEARAAVLFLKDVFLLLIRQRAHDAILEAALKAPAGSPVGLIPIYFAACVLLERRCFDQGFALLAAFRTRCLQAPHLLPTDDRDGFMVLFRHALLVNDESYLATAYFRDNLARNQAVLDGLHWHTTPEPDADGSAVLMVSCDQRYAELFLPRFIASLDALCEDRLLHLHLIDPAGESPDPDTLPRPRCNRLALTWERSGPLKCSAYYASARFVRIAALLRHYRRPILVFDADVALRHPVALAEQVLAAADFAAFRMDRLDPASVWQASVTGFRPTPAGLEMADLLHDLILSKMSIQRPLLWLVDQACLFSGVTILGDKAGRLRVADLTARLGLTVDAYVDFHDGSIDKLRLMEEAGGGSSPAAAG